MASSDSGGPSAAGPAVLAGTWVHADGNTLTVAGASFSHKTVYQGGSYREESGRITSFDEAKQRFTVEYDKAVEDGKAAELTPGTRFVIYELYGDRIRFYLKRDAYAPADQLKEVLYVKQGVAK